jgi:hypothetical protein
VGIGRGRGDEGTEGGGGGQSLMQRHFVDVASSHSPGRI